MVHSSALYWEATAERCALVMGRPPAGEAGELRAIREAGCYRDESERAFVARRLAEIIHQQRMSRTPHRAVA